MDSFIRNDWLTWWLHNQTVLKAEATPKSHRQIFMMKKDTYYQIITVYSGACTLPFLLLAGEFREFKHQRLALDLLCPLDDLFADLELCALHVYEVLIDKVQFGFDLLLLLLCDGHRHRGQVGWAVVLWTLLVGTHMTNLSTCTTGQLKPRTCIIFLFEFGTNCMFVIMFSPVY